MPSLQDSQMRFPSGGRTTGAGSAACPAAVPAANVAEPATVAALTAMKRRRFQVVFRSVIDAFLSVLAISGKIR
jgi:hypothetical protein